MLKVGDDAPDFSLPSDSGADVSLKDFKGHRLVLYFFPKADTPG
jgi:peroxiredoxin Q/BCP